MSSPFENLFGQSKEKKDETIAHAEEIYKSYKDELWIPDPQIAHNAKIRIGRTTIVKGKEVSESAEGTLFNYFHIQIQGYEKNRGSIYAEIYATDLIKAYNYLKDNNAKKYTEGFWSKFKALESENKKLREDLASATKEKSQFEKRLHDCEDSLLRGKKEFSSIDEGN